MSVGFARPGVRFFPPGLFSSTEKSSFFHRYLSRAGVRCEVSTFRGRGRESVEKRSDHQEEEEELSLGERKAVTGSGGHNGDTDGGD